jgi:hypothetical protein
MNSRGSDVSKPVASVVFDNLVWMTSEEAARYLRKSANALRIAVYRGQLRARKWRRRLYFKKVELDRLIDASPKTGGI